MNPDNPRLRHEHREESVEQNQQHLQQTGKKFESVEELLRHDAEHTAVPKGIHDRLTASISKEPAPAVPWWRKLFSR